MLSLLLSTPSFNCSPSDMHGVPQVLPSTSAPLALTIVTPKPIAAIRLLHSAANATVAGVVPVQRAQKLVGRQCRLRCSAPSRRPAYHAMCDCRLYVCDMLCASYLPTHHASSCVGRICLQPPVPPTRSPSRVPRLQYTLGTTR